PILSILEETDLQYIKDDIFVDLGFYLLNDHNQIQLIEKFEYEAKGYIRNYIYTDVKVIYTWRLLPIKLDQSVSIEIKNKSEPQFLEQNSNLLRSSYELVIEENHKYQIEKFDLDNAVENPIYLIIGDNPDKNCIMEDLLNFRLKKQLDLDILIIATNEQTRLSGIKAKIYREYDPDLIQNFINSGSNG